MNKAILIGRLTKDPELNTTKNGVEICNFTIAVNRAYSKDGEQKADFLNCIAWRKTATFVNNYFTKGKPISLIGNIQTRTYDANDGTKRYVTEIMVEAVEFAITSKDDNSQVDIAAVNTKPELQPVADDDLPF